MSISVLPTPPMLEGQDLRELVEVKRYLFRLVEQLNLSLNSLTADNFDKNTAQAIGATGTVSTAAGEEIEKTKTELKSLIIKNAKIVEAQIDEITTDLASNYVAESDFGVYRENVDAHISETAERIEQSISATNSVVGEYINTTNGYIRQGIVGHDAQDVPIIGIAIGQDVEITGEKETVNGKEYETIAMRHNMSVWTTEKLSFYVNGSEVAYFANNALHVSRINTDGITMNDKWAIDQTVEGLVIRWIGGDV